MCVGDYPLARYMRVQPHMHRACAVHIIMIVVTTSNSRLTYCVYICSVESTVNCEKPCEKLGRNIHDINIGNLYNSVVTLYYILGSPGPSQLSRAKIGYKGLIQLHSTAPFSLYSSQHWAGSRQSDIF